jgi:hypothetical protein
MPFCLSKKSKFKVKMQNGNEKRFFQNQKSERTPILHFTFFSAKDLQRVCGTALVGRLGNNAISLHSRRQSVIPRLTP